MKTIIRSVQGLIASMLLVAGLAKLSAKVDPVMHEMPLSESELDSAPYSSLPCIPSDYQ